MEAVSRCCYADLPAAGLGRRLLEPLRRVSAVIQAVSEAGAPIDALFLPADRRTWRSSPEPTAGRESQPQKAKGARHRVVGTIPTPAARPSSSAPGTRRRARRLGKTSSRRSTPRPTALVPRALPASPTMRSKSCHLRVRAAEESLYRCGTAHGAAASPASTRFRALPPALIVRLPHGEKF